MHCSCSALSCPLALLLSLVAVAALPADDYHVSRAFGVAPEPACMPALTRAPNGDLLVAFSTEWEPFPAGGVLKMVHSQDEGRTWSAPRVLWKPEDRRVTIQVANGMQTLSNGDVLLPVTWGIVPKRKQVPAGEKRPAKIYDLSRGPGYRREVRFLRSRDNGRTWAIEDPQLVKPWWRFGRLFESRDGRLIMPGNGWFIASRDDGKTWGPKVAISTRFRSETNVVEAADGTWFSIARGGGGLPRRTFGTNFSRDGGLTWGAPRSAKVQGKMPDLLVIPSGRILMTVGAEGLTDGSQILTTASRRSFCTLFVSDDHGRSWRRDTPLARADAQRAVTKAASTVPGDSPVMCQLSEGKLLVVMQGIDRDQADHPLMGYSAGMSLIGNVLAPVKR